MFERTKQIQQSFSKRARGDLQTEAHPIVGYFEFYAIVIAVPSMVIFGPGVLLVAMNVYVAKLVARNHKTKAILVLLTANLPYVPLAMLKITDQVWPIWVTAIVPLSLLLFGLQSIRIHFRTQT